MGPLDRRDNLRITYVGGKFGLPMTFDLAGLPAFLAVAETRSFRAAAERIGVSRSAVSQSVGALEAKLGTKLFHRTTRNVSLTEAGRGLFGRLGPAIGEVEAAMEAARDHDGRPSGRLRLAVSSIAESFLSGTLIASFVADHPSVQVDITVTDEAFDIAERGFDAGVRLGEVLAQDVIAVPVSGDQRQVVAAAPSYIERMGAPVHPRDLSAHVCIGWRPAPDVTPYRWDFTEHGRDFDVDVRPRVTTNDMWVMVRAAVAGGGLTFGLEETFQPYFDRGDLVGLLRDYCAPFPGFFLYYANRRDVAPKLRALLDHVRRRRLAV